ncbi:MAG: 5-(carboxyamino)imidazole ribonucleotide mutase [Synergistaceae bacterium]|jgi:5-(carboxyamino)imidazole ribonucleotide mutase|nr:5-(carboxyamino)imidazole ribonucleotide mutase [Synergistaceae bacterium]
MMPTIGIMVGSASDLDVAAKAADVITEFGVEFEVGVASAHRTPEDVKNYAQSARARGIKVIIAMAGLSAALPGVIAAHTTLPVIGVPIASGPLRGVDALVSVTQMPPGVPVGSVGIDGAKNAALLALRVLSINDETLAGKLAERAEDAIGGVRESGKKISERGLPPVPHEVYDAR